MFFRVLVSGASFVVLTLAIPTDVQAQPSQGDDHKLDAALRAGIHANDAASKRVIVRTTPDRLPRLRSALRAAGDTVLREHPLINALTAHVPAGRLQALAHLPWVESISLDAVVQAQQTASPDATLRGTLGLPVQSPAGNHVGVAIIDSGIEVGPEFDNRIAGFFDFTQGGKAGAPTDAYGHGTHVAGLIAGSGELGGKRYRGVAPKARIVALKVLDANGAGLTSDVITAIEFATANKASLDIDIINLSLGHPIYESAATDPLVQAVEAAVRAGIVVVVSGGNHGVSAVTQLPAYAGITSPGNAPSAITVGAAKTFETNIRSDDRVAAYSSRGPSWYDAAAKPDLIAPGHGLVSAAAKASALYQNNPALRVGESYLRLSGTSMAAAVATGTVALMLEANRIAFSSPPPLTPNTVKALLEYSAFRMRDDEGIEYDSLTQGAGALNTAGAIDLAQRIDPTMPVSSWWLANGVNAWTTIEGQTLSWAENVIWSDAVSSGPVVYVHEPAWAQNIVWGNNIVWGDNLIGASDGTFVSWGMAGDTASMTVWGVLIGTPTPDALTLTSPY